MTWSEVAPGRFQRGIGENEGFIKLIGDSGHASGHEHWAINAGANFNCRGSFAQHDLSALFPKVWKHLRFQHPSIAAYPINDKILEYTVPDTPALDRWAAETFSIVRAKTSLDLISSLKPNSYASLTYLLDSDEILCHTAHWRTDGIGVLQLIDAFFEIAVTQNLPDPSDLPWGQEIIRLAPAVEDAAGMPTVPTKDMKNLAQECVETFYQAAGAIGIPYIGEATTAPSGTASSRLTFDLSESQSVIDQCKNKGISVTSAIHASIAAANRILVQDENRGKHYTSTIRFSLRPYLPKPYSTPAYASGLYTTGWMKRTPASASWLQNAQDYNQEYRKGLSTEYISSHREYAARLGNLLRNMPQGGDIPSDVDISSIGIAEQLIARTKGDTNSGIDILDIYIGVEMLTRQCVCFAWTFRDQLNLNLVYNKSFHDEQDTKEFLRTTREIMLNELAISKP